MEESRDEQLDHAAGIVARVVVSANAEVADAIHQFEGINIGTDLASFSGGGEQLSANGHKAVKEVGMQRVEANAVGLQDRSESMLRDQKINEEVDPLTKCSMRRTTLRQQDRTSLSASLDLMAVYGNHEIRSRREVAVNRSHPDASRSRDVTHWCLDTGCDEHGGGGGKQRLLVALRVGPIFRAGCPAPSSMVVIALFPLSNTSLTNGTMFRIIVSEQCSTSHYTISI